MCMLEKLIVECSHFCGQSYLRSLETLPLPSALFSHSPAFFYISMWSSGRINTQVSDEEKTSPHSCSSDSYLCSCMSYIPSPPSRIHPRNRDPSICYLPALHHLERKELPLKFDTLPLLVLHRPLDIKIKVDEHTYHIFF